MKGGGYNPMRYDCEKSGCFNKKRRPKIEVFSDCFPGRINFGEVDGEVEINGYFCQIEWKGEGAPLPTGQRIKFEHYTKSPGNVVFLVEGDAETMAVYRYFCFLEGKKTDWCVGDLDRLKTWIRVWAGRARAKDFVLPDIEQDREAAE